MTAFEQTVIDRLGYLTKRVDELHSSVSGLRVKMGIIGGVAGLVASTVLGWFK